MQDDAISTKPIINAQATDQKNRLILLGRSFFKRTFDLVCSFLGLLFLSPVFLVIAMAIKRETAGKVFYKGVRMGRHEKPFNIIKFTTMRPESTESNGSPITHSNDGRITKVGSYLRNTKLNELPQLWNVLVGDMSLVGPRPEDYDLAMQWPPETRKEIMSVRPGITSPASIVYRDEEHMLKGDNFMDDYLSKILPEKMRLDQLYVRNCNMFTDIDILAATVIVLLPQIRQKAIDERLFFGGPMLMLIRRVVPWFLIDIIVATISVGISGVVWRISTVINLGVPTFLVLALSIATFISLINMLMGLQKVTWRAASSAYVVDLGFSVVITMVILYVINRFLITEPWIPFSMFWLIGITTYLGLLAVRYRERLISSLANRWLLFRSSEATFAERILIVGAGQLGELTSWLIQRSAYSTVFGVVGFVDDDPKKRNSSIGGLKVLGSTQSICDQVNKYSVGIIMLAISNAEPKEIERIKAICDSTEAKVIVMPDLIKNIESALEVGGVNGK